MLHRQACEAALIEKQKRDASETEGFVDETSQSTLDQLEALNLVFKKAAEDDTPTEVSINIFVGHMITIFLIFYDTSYQFQVPDYLCCNITLDIFRDPVITPSGVTYERAVILDHLQKVTTVFLYSHDHNCQHMHEYDFIFSIY